MEKAAVANQAVAALIPPNQVVALKSLRCLISL